VSGAIDVPGPPLPAPNALTQSFWDGVQVGELRIQRCQNCQLYHHYPQPSCRVCYSTDLVAEAVSGRATLYSWAIATQAFQLYFRDKVPYTVASVELVEQPGLMFITNVVDCLEEDLHIGMPVEAVFRRISPDLVLPLFRPSQRKVRTDA
jgi:uncharacterized OB-fold protein